MRRNGLNFRKVSGILGFFGGGGGSRTRVREGSLCKAYVCSRFSIFQQRPIKPARTAAA